MRSEETRIDGEEVECILTRYCDGCVFVDICPDDIIAAASKYAKGKIDIKTSLNFGVMYERAKLLHAIRFNGCTLYRKHGKQLMVVGWVIIPVETMHVSGEIITIDRLILLCDDNARYYTDWPCVIDILYPYLIDCGDMRLVPLLVDIVCDSGNGYNAMNVTCKYADEGLYDE